MLFSEGWEYLIAVKKNYHLRSILRRRARLEETHAGLEKRGRGLGGVRGCREGVKVFQANISFY